jgi:hypothetical protein
MCTMFWWETPKERDSSEDQGVGGKMGSEWILGRLAEGREWIGFDWLRWRWLLWIRWWTGFLSHGVSYSFTDLIICFVECKWKVRSCSYYYVFSPTLDPARTQQWRATLVRPPLPSIWHIILLALWNVWEWSVVHSLIYVADITHSLCKPQKKS